MKALKLNAWEGTFRKRVAAARRSERFSIFHMEVCSVLMRQDDTNCKI
jgi:hypothetical protein